MREYSDNNTLENFECLNPDFVDKPAFMSDLLEDSYFLENKFLIICIFFMFSSIFITNFNKIIPIFFYGLDSDDDYSVLNLLINNMLENKYQVYVLDQKTIYNLIMNWSHDVFEASFDNSLSFIDCYKAALYNKSLFIFFKCFSHLDTQVLNDVLDMVTRWHRYDAYKLLVELKKPLSYEEFLELMKYTKVSVVKNLMKAIRFYYIPDTH